MVGVVASKIVGTLGRRLFGAKGCPMFFVVAALPRGRLDQVAVAGFDAFSQKFRGLAENLVELHDEFKEFIDCEVMVVGERESEMIL
jgi:hypothetical protein